MQDLRNFSEFCETKARNQSLSIWVEKCLFLKIRPKSTVDKISRNTFQRALKVISWFYTAHHLVRIMLQLQKERMIFTCRLKRGTYFGPFSNANSLHSDIDNSTRLKRCFSLNLPQSLRSK